MLRCRFFPIRPVRTPAYVKRNSPAAGQRAGGVALLGQPAGLLVGTILLQKQIALLPKKSLKAAWKTHFAKVQDDI